MAKRTKPVVDRRNFLKGAAAGAAALAAGPASIAAEPAELKRTVPPPMSAAAETEVPSGAEVLTADRTGSDFMVDVIKSLGFEYVCANPGSSFRGIHESIINYGGNKSPEFITCCHEESSVAMAHGYYKVEGKPLAVLAHGTVGVQHAAMAIYNAYCDRVPVYVILGNIIDVTKRAPGVAQRPRKSQRRELRLRGDRRHPVHPNRKANAKGLPPIACTGSTLARARQASFDRDDPQAPSRPMIADQTRHPRGVGRGQITLAMLVTKNRDVKLVVFLRIAQRRRKQVASLLDRR